MRRSQQRGGYGVDLLVVVVKAVEGGDSGGRWKVVKEMKVW